MVRTVLKCSLTLLLMIGLLLSISPMYTRAEVIGAWLFDERSGEVAKDSSGRGVDGILTGGPEWVEGKFGGALKLEPNRYVDFPPPLSEKMILEKEFTCMAWMNPNRWEGSWNGVFSMQAGSSNGETYGIYFSNDGGTQIQCWTKINGQGLDVNSGKGAVALNEWTHGTITYDGSKLIAYKNAEKVGETATSGDLDNGDRKGRFVINGNYNSLDGGLAEWCSATVDEVLVFDTALSADEIKNYMENGFLAATAVEPSGKLAAAWGNIKTSR